MKEINRAYEILSDPDKKREYDNRIISGSSSFSDVFADIFNLFETSRAKREAQNAEESNCRYHELKKKLSELNENSWISIDLRREFVMRDLKFIFK
jgi:curved DNA-binding protein CbpA